MRPPASSSRRGRRPGAPDTRAAILHAARTSFAELGFARTTIRAVAATAGVDAALVHHYFGTKDELFLAALDLPLDPRALIREALAGDPDERGARLVGQMLRTWDDPVSGPGLLAAVRRAIERGGETGLGDGLIASFLGPVLAEFALDRPEVRVPLVASQMTGLVLLRYVLAVEPLASEDAALVAARVGPTVQRYLDGPLP